MPSWKEIIGRSFSVSEFQTYCSSLSWNTWRPSFIVLHNTANPTLAERPNGITTRHIQSLVTYYRDEMNWSAGPHLFIDDLQIWVFTPLTTSGIHSPSWNAVSLGIEMLGEYNTEVFNSGRGLQVKNNTIKAISILNQTLGLNPSSLKFHKEDSGTNHKGCPGKNVNRNDFIRTLNNSNFIEKAEHTIGLILKETNIKARTKSNKVGQTETVRRSKKDSKKNR
jgi:N-acetylmuramoyl-L-alanine amidase CwlA